MFHNIFEKLIRKKKTANKLKPKIISDIHEKDSMIFSEIKYKDEVDLEIKSLKIADYLIGNIAIERKTISDFISSMISKRLVEQLKQMQAYKQRILILEGNISEIYNSETKLNPNAIIGFILSIITNYSTPVIFTKDYKETANHLIILAKQQTKAIESALHSRIPKTIPEQKKYILESFPNIGPATSKKLLEEFKTLNNIFNAQEPNLEKILKSKSKDFKNLINS
jgi:ERCC4-type nuclease